MDVMNREYDTLGRIVSSGIPLGRSTLGPFEPQDALFASKHQGKRW
jgi:hypothetical protein